MLFSMRILFSTTSSLQTKEMFKHRSGGHTFYSSAVKKNEKVIQRSLSLRADLSL